MTSVANCTLLASALSSAYVSTAPFAGGSAADLPAYLSSHGVLLSMCLTRRPPPLNFTCSLDTRATHVSASWIDAELGLRLLPAPSAVGIVLDPLAPEADVRCLYPTDGGTDGRDGDGCGPPSLDPERGSRGARRLGPLGRWIARRRVEWYTRKTFGPNATWENVPCRRFFRLPGLETLTVWRSEEGEGGGDGDDSCGAVREDDLAYDSFPRRLSEQLAAILGRPPCVLDEADGTPHFSEGYCWEYGGDCAWEPGEWQEMVDAMRHVFLARGPEMLLWNEVVLRRPLRLGNMVSAVFYVLVPGMDNRARETIRQRAMQEAKILGNKPLLVLNATNAVSGLPLFACDLDDDEWQEASGLSSLHVELARFLRMR